MTKKVRTREKRGAKAGVTIRAASVFLGVSFIVAYFVSKPPDMNIRNDE